MTIPCFWPFESIEISSTEDEFVTEKQITETMSGIYESKDFLIVWKLGNLFET